jgi:choline dehydrogenase-like flavoprotein
MEEVDAIIVGSGAGGAPVALELATAGAKVLVLEKGPRREVKDFLHDEIAMCRRDYFVPFPDDDPHTLRRSESEKPVRTNAGWISQGVGGGTVHMSGFFFRLHPEDFTRAPAEASTSLPWPFGYDALAPHYDRVERELGVSGDVTANPFEPPRSGAFPFPPVVTHPIAAWIDAAGAKAGMHPYAVPRAIITKPHEGRGACVYCALCGSYGCEVGAKSSTLASLLPAAERTGRCEVRPGCMVREVTMMRNGRARGVVYIDGADREHEVRAKIVVIAASAIESARLLLLSRSSRHPNGLGNGAGQVGRNLCFSTLAQLAGTLRYEDVAPERRAELESPAPFIGRAVQDFYEEAGTFHVLFEHPNPIHAAERLIREGKSLVYGAPLMERLARHFLEGRSIEVEGFGEWRPTPGCYVSLDEQVTDRHGLPSACITIARHPVDLEESRVLADKGRSLLEAVGATDIRVLDRGGETLVLQHGTCRMGNDPATSVTNAAGRLHEVENVYVTDGGALPSSGRVPSTMTIMANAFRVAGGIARSM